MNPVIPILLWVAFFAVIGAYGLIVLFRPSLHLGWKHIQDTYNPKLLASHWYRLELRFAGLLLFLMFLGFAGMAGWRLTGNELLMTFSGTLLRVVYLTAAVVVFGCVVDWISVKVGIVKLTVKERINQLSPEQDAALQGKEPRIAAVVLAGMLLLILLLTWVQN